MKGVIFDCLTELIKEKYGEDKWIEILLNAGFTKFAVFLPYSDVPEEYFGRIFSSAQNCLKKSEVEVSDLFADYWMSVYAPRVYPEFFREIKSAKDFLLMMDSVHRKVTEDIPYSRPPHFEYQQKDKNTIQMYYYSSRNLMVLFESLVKATAKYFNESIEIEKLGKTSLLLKFSK